jgi:hypothetical protein
VGIGTSAPLADFVVSNGGAAGIELQPEISTDTNRITNFDRAASAYMNFKLDALTHQFLTSGTERMLIDSSGRAIIGGGITLGNGQTYAAANTLDDYEEGNWTPAIVGGTQTITAIQQARYTKIGRSVLLNVYIGQSTVTDSTSLALNGLPFTATTYNATGIVNFALNSSGGTVLCRTVPNDTKLYFYKANTNQSAVIQTQNAGHIIFSITYIKNISLFS